MHYAKVREIIKIDVNVDFVNSIYEAVKQDDVYQAHFVSNTIVIVNNAPLHNRTDKLVRSRSDLELLRLGSYS